MPTGAQIKEARSRLGWSHNHLAKRANIPLRTVERAERNNGEPLITLEHERKIKEAFRAAGIDFDQHASR